MMSILFVGATLLCLQGDGKPVATQPTEPEVQPEYSLTDPLKMMALCVAVAAKEDALKENALARKKVADELARHVAGHRGDRIVWPLKMEAVTDKSIRPQIIKYKGFTLDVQAVDAKDKKTEILHKNADWVAALKKGDYYFVSGEVSKLNLEGTKVVVTLKKSQLLPAKKQ